MISKLSALLNRRRWSEVPRRAVELAKIASEAAGKIQEAIKALPQDGFLDLWYEPYEDAAYVNFGDWADKSAVTQWTDTLSGVVSRVDYDYELGGPGAIEYGNDWVKVATVHPGVLFQKQAASKPMRLFGNLAGFFNDYAPGVPGLPSPLSAMLASGMLGAGLGYGTGWAAEKAMPEKWRRGRLRRTLAILGGLGAAVPAGLWGAYNLSQHGPAGLLKGSPLDAPPDMTGATYKEPKFPIMDAQERLAEIELSPMYKWAVENDEFAGYYGETGAFMPPIDAMRLVEVIHTPPVSQQLSPSTQAATTGLMVGAGHIQSQGQGMPRLVSPMAVGRMSAGMGSGWLSGLLVGKVLGALTGMPETAQKRLRDVGLWSGAIANMVPLVFPNR
jgi:hypothetical protein